VVLCVELAEQVGVGIALDRDTHGRRACRAGQPEGLDLGHDEAELVGERLADRDPPGAADVEVRGAAPPVADREDRVGSDEPEGEQRDRHAESGAEEHVGRRVRTEVDPRHPRHGDDPDRCPFPGVAPAAFRDQSVEQGDQGCGQEGDLDRRQRVAVPAHLDADPERPGPLERGRQQDGRVERHVDDDEVDDQVAEALEHQQRNEDAPGERPDRPPAPEDRGVAGRTGEPGAAQPGEPPHHPIVGGGDGQRRTVPAGGEVMENSATSPRVASSQPALLHRTFQGSSAGSPVARRLRRDGRTVTASLVPSAPSCAVRAGAVSMTPPGPMAATHLGSVLAGKLARASTDDPAGPYACAALVESAMSPVRDEE